MNSFLVHDLSYECASAFGRNTYYLIFFQVGPELQIVVHCGSKAGEVILQSTDGQSTPSTFVSHIRASISQLITTTSTTQNLNAPSVSLEYTPPLPNSIVRIMGLSSAATHRGEGALARIAEVSHMGLGYYLHPTIADSSMHIGALNPGSPTDGLTRVPAALGAYHVNPSLSNSQAHQCGGPWAGVDAGHSLKDGSQMNTYRYVTSTFIQAWYCCRTNYCMRMLNLETQRCSNRGMELAAAAKQLEIPYSTTAPVYSELHLTVNGLLSRCSLIGGVDSRGATLDGMHAKVSRDSFSTMARTTVAANEGRRTSARFGEPPAMLLVTALSAALFTLYVVRSHSSLTFT